MLARLIVHAIAYYRDFVKPNKLFRDPSDMERDALLDLKQGLDGLPSNADGDQIQALIYEVGKRHPYDDLRTWFGTLYEVLLGQDEGPRMGSFIALYGVKETISLIDEKLEASYSS